VDPSESNSHLHGFLFSQTSHKKHRAQLTQNNTILKCTIVVALVKQKVMH